MPTSNIKNNFALVEKQQISNIQKEKDEEVFAYIGSYPSEDSNNCLESLGIRLLKVTYLLLFV